MNTDEAPKVRMCICPKCCHNLDPDYKCDCQRNYFKFINK